MSIEALIERMSRALQGLVDLPWGIHAVVALAMAAGLVLWLTGEKMLRPIIIVLAGLIGGVLGFLIIPLTPWGQNGSLTVWHGLLGGLFVGALGGVLMFRSALALGCGVVFGVMLPLAAAAVLGLTRVDAASSSTSAQPDSMQTAIAASVESGVIAHAAEKVEQKLPEAARPAAARVKGFLTTAFDHAGVSWSSLPMVHRGIILICAAVGLAAGVIAGLSVPGWACGAISSLFGAAVWLTCFVWMSNALHTPWREQLDRTPLQWLLIWAIAGMVGMLVQWSGVLKPSTKKSEPRGKPAVA